MCLLFYIKNWIFLVAKTEKIILVAFPAMSPSNTFSLLAGQILNKNVQIAMLEISFHTVYIVISQYLLYEQEKLIAQSKYMNL